MPRNSVRTGKPPRRSRPFSFMERLKEIDRFFAGRSREHKTMNRLAEKLEKAGIPYAIIGGMAVQAQGHVQTTDDVDVLLTREGYDTFMRRFVPKSYDRVEGWSRRFLDRRQDISIDTWITGFYPGSGEPGPIAFPDPAQVSETINNVQFVNLLTLIRLKLAAGRFSDLGDVGSLIRIHKLDESFLGKLHAVLHRGFIACLEENRREAQNDEWKSRAAEQLDREQSLKTHRNRHR